MLSLAALVLCRSNCSFLSLWSLVTDIRSHIRPLEVHRWTTHVQ